MQNLLRPRVARPRKRPGRARSPLPAASGIDSVLPAPTDPAARSCARKSADGRIPAQEAGSVQPTPARSGLRALPTLRAFRQLLRAALLAAGLLAPVWSRAGVDLERGALGRSALKLSRACQGLFSTMSGACRSRARKGAESQTQAKMPNVPDRTGAQWTARPTNFALLR